ncbi:hypothetical protein ACQ33O_09515 [Ferruginibacter sp. SUN002]|uniref:hypothetical protein n=1 Tax=Ferruginibacter sp. SUN002 TaxID=2937789 RepID=UPI003D36CCC9
MLKSILLILIAAISLQLQAQDDRVDDVQPIITKKIATLKQATGWRKNDIGKWVSSPNGILSEFHDIPYANESFTSYNLYRINLSGNEYTMLVYVKEFDFTYNVLDTVERKDSKDSAYYKSKALICYGEGYCDGKFDEKRVLEEVKKDFAGFDNTMYAKWKLSVSMKWFPTKNIFRFYFDEDENYHSIDLEKETLKDKYYETNDIIFKKFIQEL